MSGCIMLLSQDILLSFIRLHSSCGSLKFITDCTHVFPIKEAKFNQNLTREQQDQADGKEVRVRSQTGGVHAEVCFTKGLDVSADHFIKRPAPGPGN